jgi:hypothetical protein
MTARSMDARTLRLQKTAQNLHCRLVSSLMMIYLQVKIK